MQNIRQPEYERLRRYRALILQSKGTDHLTHFLISENNTIGFMLIDECCIVGGWRKNGYMTIPEIRVKGNTFFVDIIATEEMLDFLGYVP